MDFISFSLKGANKSRILETQIKKIIYILKLMLRNPYKNVLSWFYKKKNFPKDS